MSRVQTRKRRQQRSKEQKQREDQRYCVICLNYHNKKDVVASHPKQKFPHWICKACLFHWFILLIERNVCKYKEKDDWIIVQFPCTQCNQYVHISTFESLPRHQKTMLRNRLRQAYERKRVVAQEEKKTEAYWNNGSIKRCPMCEIPIQKDGGCDDMTCTCGHEFSWTSGQPIIHNDDGLCVGFILLIFLIFVFFLFLFKLI